MVTKCQPDNCTKTVYKQKVTAGMTLKSSSSKAYTAEGFIPSTKETPVWMDWESRNIDINNLSGRYFSGMIKNDIDQTYSVGPWIGFQSSITIPEGKELHMRSVNCIIKGDINGSGTLIFESYQEDKAYNTPVGAKLIVEGTVASSINLVLNANATVETGITLSDNDTGISNKIKVDVPCDWPMNEPIKDENGVLWIYTEYK